MLLADVVKALTSHHVEYAIVGGYAVALYGAVRGTVDLDLVLELDEANYCAAEKALISIGLASRVPVTAKDVFHFREEYIHERNMIAWSFVDPSDRSRLVDIIITFAERKIPTTKIKALGMSIPVLQINALIAMKKTAGRAQDIQDISALERLK